jgi:SAM-dependent methyltransferase
VATAGAGRLVLECGFGRGGRALRLAEAGALVHAIDLSSAGARMARAEAAARGLAGRARFCLMDVQALGWPDRSFDLVCGSGILHHLDLDAACSEILRVMKPGAAAVFLEPLGHNPALRLFRRVTGSLRSADEHPLRMQDLARIRARFGPAAASYYGLSCLLAAPLIGLPGGAAAARLLQRLDRLLLRIPWLRPWAWMVVLELHKH